MRNLIFANITRLKKSKLFWAGAIVSTGYSAFLLIMNYLEASISPDTEITNLNWFFLSALSVAAIFCPVFSGLFIGTEYSDGTIRNKLIAGHKRSNIYLANVIVIFIAEYVIFLISSLIVIVMGIPLFGFNFIDPLHFAFDIFGGTLMLCSFAGLFTLISMVVNNKASSVAACLIVYVLLFGIANFLRIAVFSYYGEMPSPVNLNEAIRPVLEFLYDFIPTGQSLQISNGVLLHPNRFLLYAIMNTALTTISGLVILNRKNLK